MVGEGLVVGRDGEGMIQWIIKFYADHISHEGDGN
jgi:hypothetical protein